MSEFSANPDDDFESPADALRREIERLKATPVSEDELNFIKAFWRAEPSCMDKKCNANCNPLTAHCGRGP